MTHFYYYITAGRTMDETSHVYRVAIGTSIQANRDYLFLIAYSESHGHYFEIVSLKSSDFVSKVLDSGYQLEAITARDLVRSIKSQTANPLNPSALSQQHRFRMQTNLDYRISSIVKNRN